MDARTPNFELSSLHRWGLPVFWYKSNLSKLPIIAYIFVSIWGAVASACLVIPVAHGIWCLLSEKGSHNALSRNLNWWLPLVSFCFTYTVCHLNVPSPCNCSGCLNVGISRESIFSQIREWVWMRWGFHSMKTALLKRISCLHYCRTVSIISSSSEWFHRPFFVTMTGARLSRLQWVCLIYHVPYPQIWRANSYRAKVRLAFFHIFFFNKMSCNMSFISYVSECYSF